MIFWNKIIDKFNEIGEAVPWSSDGMVLPYHDNICGVKLLIDGEEIIDVACHKGSYGNENQFETLPELVENEGNGTVQGWLSEEYILNNIDSFVRKYKNKHNELSLETRVEKLELENEKLNNKLNKLIEMLENGVKVKLK